MADRLGRVSALMHTCTCILNRTFGFSRYFWVCVLLGCAAMATANPQEKKIFNIDAGPAAQTLNQYARQAGIDLGFPIDVVGDIRTNPLKGEYESREALDLLLEGTGLVAKSASSGVIISQVRRTNQEIGRDASAAKRPRTPNGTVPPTSEKEVASSRLEEILVTGTRIRGSEGASPVITITRQEIERASYATVEELIDKLPQNFGAGASHDRFTDLRSTSNVVGGNIGQLAGGSSINLRGLGASSTLVLINGRRISSSGIGAQFVDVSNIPLSAIERVDVLVDGGSAIYGADAIAGVVNFILRDDYDGAETRIRYGTDTGGDTSEALFGQSIGKEWGSGSILAFYEYYHHDNLLNTDRHFAASTDLTSLGGTDWRGTGGNPANIIAGGHDLRDTRRSRRHISVTGGI
jgi:hypothetical protein